MIYIMVLFLDIYIQMKHLLHFLLLILTLLDLLYYKNIDKGIPQNPSQNSESEIKILYNI